MYLAGMCSTQCRQWSWKGSGMTIGSEVEMKAYKAFILTRPEVLLQLVVGMV